MSTAQLPAWLRVTVVVLAVLAMFDDIRSLVDDPLSQSEMVLRICQVVASYSAVLLLAFWIQLSIATLALGFVLSLLTGNFPSTMLAASIVTLAVVCVAAPWLMASHLALSVAWVLVAGFSPPGHTDLLWVLSAPILASALVGAAVRYFLGQHRAASHQLQVIAAAHERLREQERLALARDLHDVVAHELTLVTMQAAGAHRQSDPAKLHSTISTMEDAARSGLQELRYLLQVLRESPGSASEPYRDDSASGLTTGSLEKLVESLTLSLQSAGFHPTFSVDGRVDRLPTTVRGTIARILQESTTNIIKYAPPGTECSLALTVTDAAVQIDTFNELPTSSADAAPSPLHSGFGLRGIRERVALLNGQVDYGPRNGMWHMNVWIPIA